MKFMKGSTQSCEILDIYYVLTVLLGAFLIFLSQILWSLKQTDGICTSKIFVLYSGVSLLLGSIVSKAIRYMQVFMVWKSSVTSHGDISHRSRIILLWSCLAMLMINFLPFLALCGIFGFPSAFIQGSNNDQLYYCISCAPGKNTGVSLALAIIFLATNGMVLIWCSVSFMFKHKNRRNGVDRKLSSLVFPLKQSHTIFFISSCLIISMAIFVALYYDITDGMYYSMNQYIVRSIATTINGFVAVIAITVVPAREIIRDWRAGRIIQCEHSSNDTIDDASHFTLLFKTQYVINQKGYYSPLEVQQGCMNLDSLHLNSNNFSERCLNLGDNLNAHLGMLRRNGTIFQKES